MPVKWKSQKKFNPDVVLARVGKTRMTDGEGTSFSGFEVNEDAATLHSMLDFPDIASEMDKPSLVWKALVKARPELTAATFIEAINIELTSRLRKKEEPFCFLSTISFDAAKWPKRISILDTKMDLYGLSFPKKFASRERLIKRHNGHLDIPASPSRYYAIGVSVKAKSIEAAANKALRSIDIFRAILCLEGNPGMQINLGGNAYKPINVIRMGSIQSLHKHDGSEACDAIWYEPSYRESAIHKFNKPEIVKKNLRYATRRIKLSKFGKDIAESLIRYARALDDPDPNTAFLRLWGAFESLLTPGRADYDALVNRFCFLFQDSNYHRQVLMHLREYRNASVHAGQETDQARTNCFLLQNYYRHLFWFLIAQSLSFAALAEVNEFLSMPDDLNLLKKQRQLIDKAIKYLSP